VFHILIWKGWAH